jgi:hypothetical protein
MFKPLKMNDKGILHIISHPTATAKISIFKGRTKSEISVFLPAVECNNLQLGTMARMQDYLPNFPNFPNFEICCGLVRN